MKVIDFPARHGLELNGAVLVKADTARNRLVVAHARSSAVPVIDGRDHAVKSVAVAGRFIRHLKEEALLINPLNGNVYVNCPACSSL